MSHNHHIDGNKPLYFLENKFIQSFLNLQYTVIVKTVVYLFNCSLSVISMLLDLFPKLRK